MPRPRSKKTSAEKRRKKVNVSLITKRDSQPYKIMQACIEKHHKHLEGANLAIAWRFGWKPDVDGRPKLGSVVKGSDLTRELAEFDFILLVNHEVWNNVAFAEFRQRALIDHLLCYCEISKDRNGEPVEDEKKRTVYRLRRPDVMEFKEILKRHGPWTSALDEFLAVANEAKQRPLLAKEIAAEDASRGNGKPVNRIKDALPACDKPGNADEPAANGKPLNGKSVNGMAHALDALKDPVRIKLKESIDGHPKLLEGTGHDVAKTGPGGGVLVKGKSGKLVTLTPHQYSIVE